MILIIQIRILNSHYSSRKYAIFSPYLISACYVVFIVFVVVVRTADVKSVEKLLGMKRYEMALSRTTSFAPTISIVCFNDDDDHHHHMMLFFLTTL